MLDLTVYKNSRNLGYDFIGRELPKGSYVSFMSIGNGGYKQLDIGLVCGYTNKGCRLIVIRDDRLPYVSSYLEKQIRFLNKEDIPPQILTQFKEYEDKLTIKQKIEII